MATTREAIESPVIQGAGESLPYQFTTTPWASGPVSATAALWDITDSDNETLITGTNLSGSVAILGDVIITPRVFGLTLHGKYRLQIAFVDLSANTWEAYALINCE